MSLEILQVGQIIKIKQMSNYVERKHEKYVDFLDRLY